MSSSTVRILPPTKEEIEGARICLRTELKKSDGQQEETMRSMDDVFAEKRKMLKDLLDEKI
jgi:hypothetical protein